MLWENSVSVIFVAIIFASLAPLHLHEPDRQPEWTETRASSKAHLMRMVRIVLVHQKSIHSPSQLFTVQHCMRHQ